MNRVTANPTYQRRMNHETEFEIFSDRFHRLFSQNYELTERLALRPKTETPTVNLKQLKEILLSKDL